MKTYLFPRLTGLSIHKRDSSINSKYPNIHIYIKIITKNIKDYIALHVVNDCFNCWSQSPMKINLVKVFICQGNKTVRGRKCPRFSFSNHWGETLTHLISSTFKNKLQQEKQLRALGIPYLHRHPLTAWIINSFFSNRLAMQREPTQTEEC